MAVDPKQMALAQSIAQLGSMGKQQQQEQQAAAAAPKQQALNDVSARAGLINAPDAFLKDAAAMTAKPFDNAAASASNNKAALDAYMGTLKGAQGNYMAQMGGATSLAQTDLNKAAQGANLNQLMQLLNLKNSQEDRAYNQELRQAKMDELQTERAGQSIAQSALNGLVGHSNPYARTEGAKLLAAGDLATALSVIDDPKVQKDFQKNGVDPLEMRRLVVQYYDPTTYTQLQQTGIFNPPTPSLSQPSKKPSGGKKESNLDKLNSKLPSWLNLKSAS